MGLLNWLVSSSSTRKGKIGELRVAKDLGEIYFFGYKGYCLKNVYIPLKNGTTSEIDLLYITTKGFFVIESKNYSGYIFGNENQQEWTSTLYAGKTWYGKSKVNKYKFYNPIWQNNTHIKALQEYLGFVHTFSIIVFGKNCEIKNINYTSSNVYVCHEKHLKRTLKSIWNSSADVYDFNILTELYDRLLPFSNPSAEVRQRHVNNINSSATSYICPRCGGNLVLRTAKSGIHKGNKFYGCSNYPRCKYIRNID